MTPILLAGPVSEPLSVDEVRGWLQLETHDEDNLLASMIKAARCAVEQAIRRALMLQSWRLRLPHWPQQGEVRLPLSPILSIDAVRGFDAAANVILVDLGQFKWFGSTLSLRPDSTALSAFAFGVEIVVKAGYGANASDVPEALRQGMLMLIAHWYAHRSDGLHEASVTHFPAAIAGAIMPYRNMRLR